MTKDEHVPESLKANHVKFESMTFNRIRIPIGTTSFKSNSEYPATVSLLTCSHKYGYFVMGTTDGFLFGESTRLRQHLRASKVEPTLRQLDSIVDIRVSLTVSQLHLSADELSVIVCMAQGRVLVYTVKDIVDKKSDAKPTGSFITRNEIMDFRPCPTNTVASVSATTAPTPLTYIDNKKKDITKIHNQSVGYSRLALVLEKNGDEKTGHSCSLVDWVTGFSRCNISNNNVTAICWSPKGDEFLCGLADGSIRCYSPFGLKKFEIPPPSSRQQQEPQPQKDTGERDSNKVSSRHVKEVLWLDQNTLFAIYTNEKGNDARIVKRPTKPEHAIKYIPLDDVASIAKDCPLLGCTERSKLFLHGQKFYTHIVRDISPNIKYAIIIASTISQNIMIVGCYKDSQKKENVENDDEKEECWTTWISPSYKNHFYHNGINNEINNKTTTTIASSSTSRRPKIHSSTVKYSNNSMESTHPVGVTVDYTTTASGIGNSNDSTMPALYYITDDGMISGYFVNRSDKPFFSKYEGMVHIDSPLRNIPSPVVAATITSKQIQNSALKPATSKKTKKVPSTAFLKSPSPFADAVKHYEDNKRSLWQEPRIIPSFRTLGTKPDARSPGLPLHFSTKPTFGETSMPGFRFGTTPRFGDSGPTRFGIPIGIEKSSLTSATGQHSLFGAKKEMVEREILSTERALFNLNISQPEAIDNNATARREYSFAATPFGNAIMAATNSKKKQSSGILTDTANKNLKKMDVNKPIRTSTGKHDNVALFSTGSTESKNKEAAHTSSSDSLPIVMNNNMSVSEKAQVNVPKSIGPVAKIETCDVGASNITASAESTNDGTIKNGDVIDKEKTSQAENDSFEQTMNKASISNNESGCTTDEATVTDLSVPLGNGLDTNGNKLNEMGFMIKDDAHDSDFHQRALSLLKAAGKTYATLLQEVQDRIPSEKEDEKEVLVSTSTKDNDELNIHQRSVSPSSHPDRYIQAKDIPLWVYSLGDTIDSLECDIAEKEEELARMKENLNQMRNIFTKAMNETKVKTLMIHEEEKLREKDEKLYEQTAQHLRREVFMDQIVTGTAELQQQQDKGKKRHNDKKV